MDKIYDPRDPNQSPETRHPEPYQQDLNPEAAAGQNWGRVGPHPEKDNPPTAYDLKELHNTLPGLTDDELKAIVVLPEGSRLEQGAVYIDLNDPARKEFKALGGMHAEPGQRLAPKTEVDYVLWNKLIGVTNPERLDQAGGR